MNEETSASAALDQPTAWRTAPAAGAVAPGNSDSQSRWRRLAAQAARPAVAIPAAFVGLFVLLLGSALHAVVVNSDSATIVLEGRAIAGGNPLLNGWHLSLDSFWTVDGVVYAVAERLVGLQPVLVDVVPVLIALATIALGAFLAAEGLSGGPCTAAIATVVVLLGLPGHALSFFLLQGPWHVGTCLWCLAAFGLLREGRFGWRWWLAVGLLTAGLLGDIQALTLGVLPALAAGLAAAARCRSLRAGLAESAAAVASVGLALGVRAIASATGTFDFHESHRTASFGQMVDNLGHLASWGTSLFGVRNGPFGGPAVTPVLALTHTLALLGVLGAVALSLAHCLRGVVRGDAARGSGWRLDDLLLFACLGDFATFEVLTLSGNIQYARYLTAGLIPAAILTARTVGRFIARPKTESRTRLAVGLAGLVAAGGLVTVGTNLAAPAPSEPVVPLLKFLAAHHLNHGLGDYWAASSVTLQSHGAVTVRPVVANPQGEIVADGRQSDEAWYRNAPFEFLVYERAPYGRVRRQTVLQTFGTPSHVYTVGRYTVNVWSHPLVLAGPMFP